MASISFGDDASSTATASNDPMVLKAIIRDQEHQIAQLNAEIAKLKASSPSTRPASKYPSVAGIWIEDTAEITITQSNGDFKADCSYKSDDGEVRWIMRGTITQQGKIKGTLQHIRAPKGWVLTQLREGQLSEDGNEVAGIATFSNAPHPFSWKRKAEIDAAAAQNAPETTEGKKVMLSSRDFKALPVLKKVFTKNIGPINYSALNNPARLRATVTTEFAMRY